MKRQPTGNDQSWWAINEATWEMLNRGFVVAANDPVQLRYLQTSLLAGGRLDDFPGWESFARVSTQTWARTSGKVSAEDLCHLTILDIKLQPINQSNHPRYVKTSDCLTIWEVGQLLGGN